MDEENLKYQLEILSAAWKKEPVEVQQTDESWTLKRSGMFNFAHARYRLAEKKPERITIGGKTYELREVQP